MKYRKKPVVVEAIKYNGKNMDEVQLKLGIPELQQEFTSDNIIIPTLEGDMTAKPGDFIIKGINGEFYPCKPDIFEATYEIAGEDNA